MKTETPTAIVPSAELTAERLTKYHQFLPDHLADGSGIPEILHNEPEFAPLLAEIEATRVAEVREGQLWQDYKARSAKAKRAHEKAVEFALESYGDMPAPYVEEVWVGRSFGRLDSTRPGEQPDLDLTRFWREKYLGIAATQRAILHENHAKMTARVKAREDYIKAHNAFVRAELVLKNARRDWEPYKAAVTELEQMGETPEDRAERLHRERQERIESGDEGGPSSRTEWVDSEGVRQVVVSGPRPPVSRAESKDLDGDLPRRSKSRFAGRR